MRRKRYRFTGKERDEESGLSYHGARYYAAWSARWSSADPLGATGGINLYSYAGNRPTQLVDRSGLKPFTDTQSRDALSKTIDSNGDTFISDAEFDQVFPSAGDAVSAWANLVVDRGAGAFRLGPEAEGFVSAVARARDRPAPPSIKATVPGEFVPLAELSRWKRSHPTTQDDLIHNAELTRSGSLGAILWYSGADEATVNFANGLLAAGAGMARPAPATVSPARPSVTTSLKWLEFVRPLIGGGPAQPRR